MDQDQAYYLLLRAGVNLKQPRVVYFLNYMALAAQGIPRPQAYRQLIRTHQVSLQTIQNSVRWGEGLVGEVSPPL